MNALRVRVALYLLLLAASGGVAAAADSEDAKTLRHLKTVLWPQAYREQDPVLLDRILADEFKSIDGNGAWTTKTEALQYIRMHKPSYDSLTFEITRLDIFENGTAVVAGTGTIRGKDDEGRYIVKYQSSNVLIKRGGEWKAIASHVSGVKRAPAP